MRYREGNRTSRKMPTTSVFRIGLELYSETLRYRQAERNFSTAIFKEDRRVPAGINTKVSLAECELGERQLLRFRGRL